MHFNSQRSVLSQFLQVTPVSKPQYLDEHYVTAINGVANNPPDYWTLWLLCQNQDAWAIAPVSADKITLSSGQILAWAYEKFFDS